MCSVNTEMNSQKFVGDYEIALETVLFFLCMENFSCQQLSCFAGGKNQVVSNFLLENFIEVVGNNNAIIENLSCRQL